MPLPNSDRGWEMIKERVDRIRDADLACKYMDNVRSLDFFFTTGYMSESEYSMLLDRALAEVTLSHAPGVVRAKDADISSI